MIFWIDQRELPSKGIKLAEIPSGFNSWGEPTSYSLELFVEGVGKFDNTPYDYPRKGVLLKYHAGYYGNENTGDNDSVNFAVISYYNAFFFERDYYRNEEFGFEIKILGYEGTGADSRAQVQVNFFCPGDKVAPTVNLDIPQEAYAGDSVDFKVAVQNNNVIGCGTQTCAVSISKPWQASLGIVETGAYQTTNTSFKVAIPADTKSGIYEIELSAMDIDEQTAVGKATDTIIVLAPIPTPTPSPTPTVNPTPSPTPSPTPTPPPCTADVLDANPEPLKLRAEGRGALPKQ